MLQSKVVGALLLLALNGLSGADAKLAGKVSVAKPSEELLDEDFFDAVAGTGTQRKLTLGLCQSDCDSNSDCSSGLICWQRRTGDPLPPCCSGSQPSDSRDFCVPSGCSSGGGGGGVGGGGDLSVDAAFIACFSGETVVEVFDRGSIAMKDLSIGDQILSAVNGNPNKHHYQPVYSFAHYHPTRMAKFLVIHTDDDSDLEITGDHLIFVEGKSNPVRAISVRPGDRLAPSGTTVTAIGETTKPGIYTPMTPDATFLLNDGNVQVSSYSAIVQSANEEYATFRDGTKVIAQHTGIHMVLSPYRMWCRATSSFKCDSYNEEGMPQYVAGGISFLEKVDQQPQWFQAFLFLLAFPFFGTLIVLESIIFNGPGLVLLMGLGAKVVFGKRASS